MNFRFDEKAHKYYLDDELLPGVTTILGTLNKPALVQWAANEAVKYVENAPIFKLPLQGDEWRVKPDELKAVLEEARTAHAKKRDKAADQGTDVHAQIETYIKSCIETNKGVALAHSTDEAPQASKFVDWAMTNGAVFHESEKKLYSPLHKFAGTTDFTATVNGKRLVGDIKTTSGIYDLSPFLQCAAYRIMLEEMGEPNYDGSVIIRLGKDGAFEEYYRYDETGEDKQTFLSLLDVYKAMARFKNTN